MYRLISILWFFVIGCSESQMNPMAFEDCECGLEISSTLPYNETDESYELEYNAELSQTYASLNASIGISALEHEICRSPESSRNTMKHNLPIARCCTTRPATTAMGRGSVSGGDSESTASAAAASNIARAVASGVRPSTRHPQGSIPHSACHRSSLARRAATSSPSDRSDESETAMNVRYPRGSAEGLMGGVHL